MQEESGEAILWWIATENLRIAQRKKVEEDAIALEAAQLQNAYVVPVNA